MDITDVRVYLASGNGSTRAYASITFDDSFVVRNLRIVDGKKGLFVSMPSRRDNNGEFRDICHPINSEMRQRIEDAVLGKYKEEIA